MKIKSLFEKYIYSIMYNSEQVNIDFHNNSATCHCLSQLQLKTLFHCIPKTIQPELEFSENIWKHIYLNTEMEETVNSLPPGRYGSNFTSGISEHILHIKFMSTSCQTAVGWMSQNTFDDKSTLVQVMTWCHQAASYYLTQCSPRSMSPYSVTRPQWVNILLHGRQGTTYLTQSS